MGQSSSCLLFIAVFVRTPSGYEFSPFSTFCACRTLFNIIPSTVSNYFLLSGFATEYFYTFFSKSVIKLYNYYKFIF